MTFEVGTLLLILLIALVLFLFEWVAVDIVALGVLPVALQTTIQFGFNPRTFAMMIAVAASTLPGA
jgi:di/tricarboxylate transporter